MAERPHVAGHRLQRAAARVQELYLVERPAQRGQHGASQKQTGGLRGVCCCLGCSQQGQAWILDLDRPGSVGSAAYVIHLFPPPPSQMHFCLSFPSDQSWRQRVFDGGAGRCSLSRPALWAELEGRHLGYWSDRENTQAVNNI